MKRKEALNLHLYSWNLINRYFNSSSPTPYFWYGSGHKIPRDFTSDVSECLTKRVTDIDAFDVPMPIFSLSVSDFINRKIVYVIGGLAIPSKLRYEDVRFDILERDIHLFLDENDIFYWLHLLPEFESTGARSIYELYRFGLSESIAAKIARQNGIEPVYKHFLPFQRDIKRPHEDVKVEKIPELIKVLTKDLEEELDAVNPIKNPLSLLDRFGDTFMKFSEKNFLYRDVSEIKEDVSLLKEIYEEISKVNYSIWKKIFSGEWIKVR